MASNFTNFMISISENPQLLEELKTSPEKAFSGTKLTPAEQVLAKSGDAKLVREAILSDPDLPQDGKQYGCVVVVIVIA